jgi:hypothetical protein
MLVMILCNSVCADEIVVIRYGKLPKGLPDWWSKLDIDKDGQIAMWEF